jgi:hypothetical protein
MFASSIPPIVCRRAHVLFTLFVFNFTYRNLPYFPYQFTIQLAFFPYFPYLFPLQLTFLPYFPYHFTFHPYFPYHFTIFFCIFQIISLFNLSFFHNFVSFNIHNIWFVDSSYQHYLFRITGIYPI